MKRTYFRGIMAGVLLGAVAASLARYATRPKSMTERVADQARQTLRRNAQVWRAGSARLVKLARRVR